MSKLRLIQHRTQQVETSFDLRGLGQERFFTESAPHACLAVDGVTDLGFFENLARDFDLSMEQPYGKDTVLLRIRNRRPGEHKHQAAALFVVALDVSRHRPQARMRIFEVRSLMHFLKRAIVHRDAHGGDAVYSADESWQDTEHPMTIDAATTHHLHQAGFDVAKSEVTAVLTHEMIRKHQESLSTSTTTKTSVPARKTGQPS